VQNSVLLGVDHLKAIFEEDLSNYNDTSSLIEHLRTRCVRRTATHSHAQPRMQHGDVQHATGQELVNAIRTAQ
jgi:hypothetical protein